MPRKVYQAGEYRPGGGTTFHISFERIERMLRGDAGEIDPLIVRPSIHRDEVCEFVLTPTGINVYVEKKG